MIYNLHILQTHAGCIEQRNLGGFPLHTITVFVLFTDKSWFMPKQKENNVSPTKDESYSMYLLLQDNVCFQSKQVIIQLINDLLFCHLK